MDARHQEKHVNDADAPAANLYESFQFLVRHQAKSIVAIQELQQDVGDLLLFRQAVLAALPHLQPKTHSADPVTSAASCQKLHNPAATWTRKRHLQQQQYRSYESQNAAQAVVDSGFSTEANSNSSPRSSRVETQPLDTTAPPKLSSPTEKDITQQLDRVRSRISRLKKDEDRLSALLNPDLVQPAADEDFSSDELWQLLEEIETKSREMRFQVDRLQPSPEDGANSSAGSGLSAPHCDNAEYLLGCLERLEKDVGYWKRRQSESERDLGHAEQRCQLIQQEMNLTAQRICQAEAEIRTIRQKLGKNSPDAQQEARHGRVSMTVGIKRDSVSESQPNIKKKVSFQDGVATLPLSSPASSSAVKYVRPSREKISAILKTTDPIQLQRRVILATVENEALREQIERSKQYTQSRESWWQASLQEAADQAAQLKEENEDLRFQLMEQSIELEGTKARLRLASRTPPPVPDRKATPTQTDFTTSDPVKVNGFTQTDRILPRVIDTSPKIKPLATAQDICSSWEDEEKHSVERRSYNSRIPTPIRPAGSLKNTKRELPNVPTKMDRKSRDKDALPSRAITSNPRPSLKTKSPTETKVIMLTSTPLTTKTRASLTDPYHSEDDLNSDSSLAVTKRSSSSNCDRKTLRRNDDYYDSINDSRYQSSCKSDFFSPMDSLERSLPSVGINYHCKINGNRSYSSASITPSNSLSLNG